jgi:2-amino-4-hydroxy-6-hydroxymethyldihydropteridine diphosphokinase
MIVIGLGSNVGDRLRHLEVAVGYLSGFISNIDISAIYESPALLKDEAPGAWNVPFLNMAIKGETNLSAQLLLEKIKQVEKQIGRVDRGIWAPREIDIDILVYGDIHINENNLVIPHAGLCQRDFVLLPLADVAPQWCYPVNGEYYGKTANTIFAMAFTSNSTAAITSHIIRIT